MRRLNGLNDATTPSIRVAVLGGHGVGKSALVVRFLTKRFIGEYVSGTEITYLQEVNLSGNKVTAEICDALIKKEPHEYLMKLATHTQAYLIVYNVCCRTSFDYACHLVQEVQSNHNNQNKDNSTPILLVGNKSDLGHLREVKLSEGENFAKTLPQGYFIETSAAESYSDVEKAFRLVFQLVRKQTEPIPVPSVAATRHVRKNSISQMAQLIREHVRNKHSSSSSNRSNSLERGRNLSRSQSVAYDNNNNTTMSDHFSKRRTRKNGIAMLHQNNSSILNNAKPKTLSKCLSLSTLNEKPSSQTLKKTTNLNAHLNDNLSRYQRYHTVDGNLSEKCRAEMKTNPDSSCATLALMKMSLSSDETAELSDMSTPEEDAFFSDGAGSTPLSSKSSNTNENCQSPQTSQSPTILFTSPEGCHRSSKTMMNKNNLKITVHSDGELDDKDLGEFNEVPPKSAPLVHSTSGSKFRYFPNAGVVENTDQLKPPGWSGLTASTVPVSPLLDRGKRQVRVKSPKEEKKSPSNNLLKQFFKGALHGSSSSNKNLSVPSQNSNSHLSPASSEVSLSTVPIHSRNTLTSINEQNTSANSNAEEPEAICFRASSESLSSIVNNDVPIFDSFLSTSSAPSSPQVNKLSGRRASFRETVGDLIRKRKKSIVR